MQTQDAPPPLEVIVVDGNSTGGTRDVVREFDVRLVEQSGIGIGTGRHEGAGHADGDWLDVGRVRAEY